ncbi:Uncharacterized copper-binding protein [Delftia tsuruhatensis]|uniref:DUF411 domain-containing protein n=1 Tax=Delftia tsuruhatensis TaxID=180282 RepID=UPI001E6B6B11|nr:DUF411 domain-containing protein [Delftia tsuruhatensis]CAB5711758.1 Uncharacterized copper-binding protein [Delftia tsuruhatensis]CAC9686930.1 Uncharacterized copper-binding protein [Delftia tsuruhatensis]
MSLEHTTSAPARRAVLRRLALAGVALAAPALWAAAPAKRIPVEVWKDPSCGCCQDWVVHMEQNGFAVTVHDTGNNAVRAKLGLPTRLGSCHTALVEGYVLEGHVPAADVHKLLRQKPKALGIAVPGMPVGSPGMDGPEYGGRKDPYDVLLVTKNLMNSDVTTQTFTSYR